MRRSREQLIVQLKGQGLYFCSFSMEHEGYYAVADAEWNYKDVPHLHCVHELVETVIANVGRREISTINLQKVLGVKIPMAVFNYSLDERTQIYYTTFLFFVLVVETTYDTLDATKTKVVTTYSVGSPKFLKFLFPLIRWLIKKNYKNLMTADIPMRERRGQLRSWGYTFKRPSEGYGFEQTMNLVCSNVVAPAASPPFSPVQLSIEQGAGLQQEWLVGRDDHLGLRVVRREQKLFVYGRMCPHEGASLDRHPCVTERITCPWHGRVFTPLAELNLLSPTIQKVLTEFHEIVLEKNILYIQTKDKVSV